MKNTYSPTLKFLLSLIACFLQSALGLNYTNANNTNKLSFTPLNINTLLPTNEVRNIYQDSEGYIWISTYNGLLRYDGYSIINYKHVSTNSQEQFIDNFINSVCEDKSHMLWIGTHNGLYCLNKRNGNIEIVTSAGLHNIYVETIKCTSKGDVMVGTTKGLYMKEKDSDDFIRMFPSTNMDVKAIMEDNKNHIWIGTWNQGLFRYDIYNKRLYSYPDINPGKSAHAIYQDRNNNIWIGTWRYGLIRIVDPYDMEKYSFIEYKNNINDPESISDNIIYIISQDNYSDDLWIGTRRGLSIMSTKDSKFTNFYPNTQSNSLRNGEVNSIMCSKDGLMWIGMLGGGISTVNTKEKQFLHDSLIHIQGKNSTSVRSIYKEEDKDVLWIGIMGFGFGRYDLKTKEFKSYKEIPEFSKLPYISVVNEITYNKSDKNYYISTWDDGIWVFDGKNVKVVNQSLYPNLTDVCIYTTIKDKDDNLWIGSRSGLFVLDKNNNLCSVNNLLTNKKQQVPDISIFKLITDVNGNIWAATPNQGVFKISKSDNGYVIKNYTVINNNATMHGAMTIFTDSHNNIWVGTNGNGINLYDPNSDCFKCMFNEYIEKYEVVYCILEDDNGNLWFTTNSKMYNIINPLTSRKTSAHIYTVEDGLQDNIFNRNACFKSEDNKLYFGGVKGINIFSPDDIIYDKVSYPVVITDLKIYNKSVLDNKINYSGNSEQKPLDYTNHITLDYKSNNFSLDFSILSYINPQLNNYMYILQGYDKDWIHTSSDRHFAYYNNLPSGEYCFRVKGANSNGEWSDNIRTMYITILPPPWLTWWAYTIYTILAITIIMIIKRTVSKRIHLQQMVELGKIQAMKDEEINHTRLQFFTNITHELLTPLTIISASIEDLKLHVPSVAGRLQEIEDNSHRLIRLIQQILEFRKVENNKQQLKVSFGNITKQIRHSCLAFAPLVRKKNLKLQILDGEKEYYGYYDSDKLDKILYNLLSNAAKYTPKDETITLKQYFNEENEIFTFSINNPGDIIPEDKLKHMFERFYEGEYRKFKTIGTGIGLSLTKDLTILHHGNINVESNAEEGITFTVSIPTNKNAFSEQEIEEEMEETEYIEDEETEIEEYDYTNKSDELEYECYKERQPIVLLVEDNEDLINVISRILSDYFYVIKAQSGEQALEELKQQKIDIVVSDIMMNGMNGLELCKEIKETFETKHIPVILITAKTSDQERIEGYNVGADGYICKPLNINVLIARINNLLNKGMDQNIDSRKQLVFAAKDVDYTEQDEILLKKVIDCINEHIDDINFDTTMLIEHIGMSRSAFTEKMKQLTGMTPLIFISSIRLQAAFRLLQEKKNIRITELAYSVGFNDPKYFSQCFRKKFGMSPKEFQKNKTEE